MIKIGYFNNQRLHVDDYNPAIHEGRVKCEEGHVLIAKKGEVRMHHFSHRAADGASCGSKGTGDWHLWWQGRINKNNIEFRIQKDILKIADTINIIGPNKDTLSIVEYQSSVMSAEEFAIRENFYTRRDLLSQWGLQDCNSTLTWVFNLKNCDIEIDHIFGDVVCFRWIKGTKFMLNAKAKSYYDFGKRDLVLIHGISKPKIVETKFVGQLVPISDFDKFYFEGVINPELSLDQQRLNVHKIEKYECIKDEVSRSILIEMVKSYYFKGETKKSKKCQVQIKKYTLAEIKTYASSILDGQQTKVESNIRN